MNRKQPSAVWAIFLVSAFVATLSTSKPIAARAAGPAATSTPKSEPKPAAAPAKRTENEILADLRAAKEQLDTAMPALSAVADPLFRKEDGPKVRPLLQNAAALLDELAQSQTDNTEREALQRDRCQYLAILAALGDDEAEASLEKTAGGDGANALAAQSAIALRKWWQASKDAAAQQKILTDYTAIARSNPESNNVALTLAVMAGIGPATDDMPVKIAEVLRKVMKGERAKKLAAQLDPSGAQRDLVHKGLVAAGRTASGKNFSTDDWKGKVVLLDFWATWCGPCNAEIPRMKELYKTYHGKGLEIVGLDCDGSDDTVNSFVKQKEMPWPQMREAAQSESEPWHPLASAWGVNGIPTMFLIDKRGVLRFIDAREDTAAKIESLLGEKK
ncbi:MAG TPA: TlpA disulfide reductase family protein [Pirellulales bacterium]|nr:TlpA disulfide reductase family protein [Pirellulales bacterium]